MCYAELSTPFVIVFVCKPQACHTKSFSGFSIMYNSSTVFYYTLYFYLVFFVFMPITPAINPAIAPTIISMSRMLSNENES